MKTKEFLDNVCREIKYKPANRLISEELHGHIQDMKNEYLCKGYSEEVAEEKAIEQMGNAKEIGKRLNKVHKPKLDWKLLILIIILMCFSVLSNRINADETSSILTIFLLILSTLMIYFYDYRKLSRHSLKLYIIATIINIMACILGFRSYGSIHGGLPFTTVAPTVISIPLYVIAFAGFIDNIIKSSEQKLKSNLIKIIVLSCISIISLLMINTESGLIVGMVYLVVSTVGLIKKKKIKYIVLLLGVSIIVFLLLASVEEKWFYANLEETERIYSYSEEAVINDLRSEILNSAKLFGKADLGVDVIRHDGVDISTLSYFNKDSNFVFIDVLANYGWIVSISMVLVIILLNIKLIINSIKVEDSYGKLINISISILFMLETVFNLAMNLGFGEITDFTIPLVAKGKTSLIINMMCLTLALSVYRRKNINYEETVKRTKLSKILLKLSRIAKKFEESF